MTKRGEPFRDKTCIRGEIRRYLILNSDPDEYPPIGTSLGHFREHGNGRAMFRLQYPQHSYLSDLTGKPRMRKKVFFLQCIRFNLVYIYSAWTSGSTQQSKGSNSDLDNTANSILTLDISKIVSKDMYSLGPPQKKEGKVPNRNIFSLFLLRGP